MIPDAWRDERVEKADYPRQHDCWAWVALCVVSLLCPGREKHGTMVVFSCKHASSVIAQLECMISRMIGGRAV